MKIEFGEIQTYNTDRGFGFLSRTFKETNQRRDKGVWFHITAIKHDYPSLAKELDAGSSINVKFWYEIENSDREKVGCVWLDPKDIPETQKNELVSYIEALWCDIDRPAPEWLDEITLALVGQIRQNELNQERNELLHQRQEAEEQERISQQSGIERRQKMMSDRLGRRKAKVDEEAKQVYIGLPENLVDRVLWVADEYRPNELSHTPGGYEVVVEYYHGDVRGYDKVKIPSAYIGTFFAGNIKTVYARKYNKKRDNWSNYEEAWNAEKSTQSLLVALKNFEADREQKEKAYEIDRRQEEELLNSYYNTNEVWQSWYNEDEEQWYFGECPECNIPDRD